MKELDGLIEFINKYSQIVLKPIKGEQGKGVYILNKNNNDYSLGYSIHEEIITLEELAEFFKEIIKKKKYIAQKYIRSKTLRGDPFDCRVHLEKNREGKWVTAKSYVRIGIGQKVISNANRGRGSGISNLTSFLKENFERDKQKEIRTSIKQLAQSLPYKIEELRDTHLMTIGLDIGIDRDGKLYLFESNGAPMTSPLKAEVAMLRAGYYKFLIENKL